MPVYNHRSIVISFTVKPFFRESLLYFTALALIDTGYSTILLAICNIVRIYLANGKEKNFSLLQRLKALGTVCSWLMTSITLSSSAGFHFINFITEPANGIKPVSRIVFAQDCTIILLYQSGCSLHLPIIVYPIKHTEGII